ncbi:MAG TPA: response regulator transcription factor [Micromonosporaceae bacterium]
MRPPVRVLIADDDDLMRAGLRAVLASDDGIAVAGEAADGHEAVRQVRATRPDVVLMDVRMPDLDGIAATRQIVEAVPTARILMLTTFEDDDYVFGALSAGASGFLLKRTQPEQLIAAIHVIAAGESLLSPSVTRTVIDRMARQPQTDPGARRRLRELTPREREILQHVARGLSNQEIAETVFVEESTVKTHMKRILAKLGLRDRVQAVILGYETGLVRPGESAAGRRAGAAPDSVHRAHRA